MKWCKEDIRNLLNKLKIYGNRLVLICAVVVGILEIFYIAGLCFNLLLDQYRFAIKYMLMELKISALLVVLFFSILILPRKIALIICVWIMFMVPRILLVIPELQQVQYIAICEDTGEYCNLITAKAPK